MKLMFASKSRIVLLSLVLCGLVIADWWMHSTPMLRRIDPELYYLIKVGEAGQLRDHGDLIAATRALKSAAREFPTYYQAYFSLGNVLLEAGNTNAALSNYIEALNFCGKCPTNLTPINAQLAERHLIAERIRGLRPSP